MISAERYEELQDFNAVTQQLHSYRQRNLHGLMAELREEIPDRPIRVLEIGCAAGRTYGMLAHDFPLDYVGIDFRRDRVELARQRYPGAEFIQADAGDQLLYQPNSADIVFALETLEHIAEDRVVRIVERVCKFVRPRMFVVSVPVEIGPTVWLKELGSRLMGYDRAAGYNAADLFWAGLGQLNRVRTHERGHRGFNWRWLEQTIRYNARLRETRSMPFAWFAARPRHQRHVHRGAEAMTDYGGMGGITGGRGLETKDAFEMAVERSLGAKMREDVSLCIDLWSALANVDWQHKDGDTAGYSFRAAGDLIAAVLGRGDYMDWYCVGPEGMVSAEIEEAMAQEGWLPAKR